MEEARGHAGHRVEGRGKRGKEASDTGNRKRKKKKKKTRGAKRKSRKHWGEKVFPPLERIIIEKPEIRLFKNSRGLLVCGKGFCCLCGRKASVFYC